MAVTIGPRKKSPALIVVSPRPSRTTISAPSVSATSGISAAGSACAIEPPIVPRRRVAGCPTQGNTLARSGSLVAISGSRSAAACRVVAPMTMASPLVANARQFRQAEDVDQPSRASEPHRQHRHQRLPAGNDARVAVLRQQHASLIDGAWPDVIERNGLHARLRSGARSPRIISEDLQRALRAARRPHPCRPFPPSGGIDFCSYPTRFIAC